ncbi:hypothetical protein BDW68DRAFT_164537 [Aspergillus falconensis]
MKDSQNGWERLMQGAVNTLSTAGIIMSACQMFIWREPSILVSHLGQGRVPAGRNPELLDRS